MAIRFPYYALLTVFASSYFLSAEESPIPKFAFSWLDDKNTFQAGEIAVVKIKVLRNFDNKGNDSAQQSAFNPTITVNGKTGNISYISGVLLDLGGDPSTWKISFTPIVIGVFNLIITDENFKVLDSSLHFEVEAGQLFPSFCVVSWMGLINDFEAGANASTLILPKDAFGNNFSSAPKELDFHEFSFLALYENGSIASIPSITRMDWDEFGYIIVELVLVNAGSFLLLVEKENQILNGSPLPFKNLWMFPIVWLNGSLR